MSTAIPCRPQTRLRERVRPCVNGAVSVIPVGVTATLLVLGRCAVRPSGMDRAARPDHHLRPTVAVSAQRHLVYNRYIAYIM